MICNILKQVLANTRHASRGQLINTNQLYVMENCVNFGST